MISAYPEAREYVSDPERYFERVCERCNYLDAVKALEWSSIIPPGARILDLAGGTGWLAAYMSTFPNAKEVTIVDASRGYLELNLPVSIRRLGGDPAKIRPVVGYFAPLIFPDTSLDLVVVSSSLHHADNLETVLKEIHRVLVPGGKCFVLNEVPVSDLFYLRVMMTTFGRALIKTVTRRYAVASPSVSSSGILYDPLLGDRMYPVWYWNEAIRRAGFRSHRRIETGLAPVKGVDDRTLVHFVCSKEPN